MAKGKSVTVYFCQNCGYESSKWMGQCPGCREWNTMTEELVDKKALSKAKISQESKETARPVSLSQIESRQEERISTGFGELDRVLGGGIVPGSLVLVGGDPGIGKSTLLLQVCQKLSEELEVLYISGDRKSVV